jgi:hypothetical protein
MLWDRLYMEMVIKLEEVPLGYTLEPFVESLSTPHLKIVYKMLCKKTMKKKEASVYDDIYDALKVFYPDYPGKEARITRLYGQAYNSVDTDVNTNRKGRYLQSYIHRLSIYELDELTTKIRNTNQGNWIGKNTFHRELRYLCDSPNYPPYFLTQTMSHTEMVIHCHFSEILALGYHFTVLEYYQNSPNPVPLTTHVEALIYLNDTLKDKRMLHINKMTQGITRFYKTIILEEAPPSLTECSMDCVVCMESKPDKQYVKFNCNHEFCGSCVGHMIETGVRGERDILCPLCRSYISKMVYGKLDVMVEMRKIIVA